jgi:hypothetical protein
LILTLVSCQAGSCQAATEPPDLTDAKVQGLWELTVSVSANTGPAPSQTLRVAGTTGIDKVVFHSDCSKPGQCALQMWGPDGPNSQQAAYYQYFGKNTSLAGPPVSIPMMQAGVTYDADVPASGFGGQVQCPPPRSIPPPTQHLRLSVTDATYTDAGWLATALVGSQTVIGGWGCDGTVPSDWVVIHLDIAGRISKNP